MSKLSIYKMSLIATVTMFMLGCNSTYETTAPTVSSDGLELTSASRSTLEYQKTSADFSKYNKVHILPSQVAFKDNWMRDYNKSQSLRSNRVKEKDVERIKNNFKTLLDDVFNDEFSQPGDSILVDKLTAGTLVVKPAVINLDVRIPDVNTSWSIRTSSSDAGEATLLLELYDGVSGEILARVIDTQVTGAEGNTSSANNNSSNKSDAQRLMSMWAKDLRSKFDDAQVSR